MWASADGEKRRGILAEFIGIPGALKVAWEATDSIVQQAVASLTV